MSYDRLILEHIRIDAALDRMLALAGTSTPDIDAIVTSLGNLSGELSQHLADEDSLIYPRLMTQAGRERADEAQDFVLELAALRDDWQSYLNEWSSATIARDWENFRAHTVSILTRVSARVAAENDLLTR